MAGRIYTVPIAVSADNLAAASGDIDWWEIQPADDKPVRLLGFALKITSETGDAADEWVPYQVIRGYTSSGSGGSSGTAADITKSGTAAGFTAEILNTTVATTGSPVICWADAVNVRGGDMVWFPAGVDIVAAQGDTTIVVRQMAAVADNANFTGTLVVEELA